MPDARAYTMWDTLANTIADDQLTLYLILDEAHRGMRQPNRRGSGREGHHRAAAHKRCEGRTSATDRLGHFRYRPTLPTRRWKELKGGPPILTWLLTPC